MEQWEKNYTDWLDRCEDVSLSAELESIAGNRKEIKNRFYRELEFGTGGLRGVIAAGSNCLNVYTVRRATAGLADYLKAGGENLSVAISYDSRINSRLFAETAACAFASRGFTVYLTDELMPTPFLSYAVRSLGCCAGVMITASHNPAEYNGYKVYGADGCQITDSAAAAVTKCIDKIDVFTVKTHSFLNYVEKRIIHKIGQNTVQNYLLAVEQRATGHAKGLKVVYTPLNGTGYKLIPEILKRIGVSEIVTVPEQSLPNGNFPTCPYPNPEKREALELGIRTLKQTGADILMATDPDADRVGTAVSTPGGTRLLTGNEMGALLTDYLLSRAVSKSGGKPPVIIKTIVTTELGRKIAEHYGAEVIDVLTGFKYIGEKVGELEARGEADRFVLGFEESYGYLAGSYVRDKDAVAACMLIASMCAHYKAQGITLADRLEELYRLYGRYEHRLVTRGFTGAEGNAKMKRLMSGFRKDIPKAICGRRVERTVDYLTRQDTLLPMADVISIALEGGAGFIVRPSGTEPQIKFYLTAVGLQSANMELFTGMENLIEERF